MNYKIPGNFIGANEKETKDLESSKIELQKLKHKSCFEYNYYDIIYFCNVVLHILFF